MKIASVSVSLLDVPLQRPWRTPRGEIRSLWYVLAELTTEDGTVGIGYDIIQRELAVPIAAATRELGNYLVDLDVVSTEAAWDRMARAGRWVGPGGMLHFAIAPLDTAVWDALGKTLRQPLYRLLGGFRQRVPVYDSDDFWFSLSIDELVESARKSVAHGFKAIKVRVGNEKTPQDELRRLTAVRNAIGPDVTILLEVAENWDVARAVEGGRALQGVKVGWIEDPINHKNLAGLARIASSLDIPVATGEHLYEVGDFVRLFQEQASSVGLIDLGRIGGVTPWRRVATVAHAFDVPVCGHMVPELHIHLTAAIPNGFMIEYLDSSAAILEAMPAIEGGSMVAPDLPGFGLQLDPEAVRRYRREF